MLLVVFVSHLSDHCWSMLMSCTRSVWSWHLIFWKTCLVSLQSQVLLFLMTRCLLAHYIEICVCCVSFWEPRSRLLVHRHWFNLRKAIGVSRTSWQLPTAWSHVIDVLPTLVAEWICRVIYMTVFKPLITTNAWLNEVHVDHLARSVHLVIRIPIGESWTVIFTCQQ